MLVLVAGGGSKNIYENGGRDQKLCLGKFIVHPRTTWGSDAAPSLAPAADRIIPILKFGRYLSLDIIPV
jgi:hypothetical protein